MKNIAGNRKHLSERIWSTGSEDCIGKYQTLKLTPPHQHISHNADAVVILTLYRDVRQVALPIGIRISTKSLGIPDGAELASRGLAYNNGGAARLLRGKTSSRRCFRVYLHPHEVGMHDAGRLMLVPLLKWRSHSSKAVSMLRQR